MLDDSSFGLGCAFCFALGLCLIAGWLVGFVDFVAVLVCAFDTRCGVCCRYLCLLASDGRCSMVGVGFCCDFDSDSF